MVLALRDPRILVVLLLCFIVAAFVLAYAFGILHLAAPAAQHTLAIVSRHP